MGIATRIAVRLTPDPPVVRTLLLDFTSIEDAAATVSGIIAAGIVPAALEMMDAEITRAVEDYVGAGYPRDAAAVLLVEVDGLGGGVAHQVDAVERVGLEHGARTVRVAADDAERALLWKGRKSAFGAIARIAPDYYLHDAVVPRTKLVDVLRQVYAIAHEQRLTMMNVFHAGDGNLHPLIVFDAREPGVWERVHRAGDEILAACVAAGGVLSGEHGIGLEKREAMPLVFSADDLDAQARLRDAFDPSGRANPRKVLPRGSRCGELPARPRGRVDLMATLTAVDELCETVAGAGTVAAVGSRTHWEVGGPAAGRGRRDPGARARRHRHLRPGRPHRHRRGGHPQRRAGRGPRRRGPGVRARSARPVRHRRRVAGDGPVRAPPPPSRTAARPRARGALRHRRRTAREGRGTDGQERERLRPAPPPRRLARLASACSCRSPCGASPSRRAPSGSSTAADPFALRRDLYRPSCLLWDGTRTHVLLEGIPADVAAERARIDGAEAATAPALPDRAPSWSYLGAAIGAARSSRRRSTRSACAGWRGGRRRHRARGHRRRDRTGRCPRRGRRRRWLAAARGRRARSRRLRRRRCRTRS